MVCWSISVCAYRMTTVARVINAGRRTNYRRKMKITFIFEFYLNEHPSLFSFLPSSSLSLSLSKMKLYMLLLGLALCLTSVWAWDKDDHEIFDIVAALEKAEGKGTTFYSFLDVSPSASVKEIGKAYRTKSVSMHPDKNPGDKTIQDRFARLGVISTILRDEAKRKRYDFFYKNGVPKWKGTGYLYARWRPGFFFTLFFLALVSSGFQFIFQKMNHSQDLGRINDLISKAQLAAWGPNEKFRDAFAKKKVAVPVGTAGRQAELLVMQDGDVFLLDPPNEPTLLSASMLVRPTYANTWPVTLGRSLGGKLGLIKSESVAAVAGDDSEAEPSGASDGEVVAESSAVSTEKKAKKGKASKRR